MLFFASGDRVDIQDTRKLVCTKPALRGAPGVAVSYRRNPTANCMTDGETALGPQTIGKYRAMGITSPGHKIWYALDHGCAMVRERFEFADGVVSEKTLLTLIPGEPDPALFEVPPTYTEVPPSVLALYPGQSRTPWQIWRDEEYTKRLAATRPAMAAAH